MPAEPGPGLGDEAAHRAAFLRCTCFHQLQEHARHAGHLDVLVELAGGPTGE